LRSVDEVKDIIDTAIAMACYARQAKNKNLEADATEIRFRATRKLDKLRVAQRDTFGLAKGTRGQLAGSTGSGGFILNPPEDGASLAASGIDKNLAHRARMLGALSDEEFEAVVKENRARIADEADRITRRTINVAARKSTESRQVVIPDGRYGCIVIDPPWPMEKIERDIAEIIGKEYPAFEGTDHATVLRWIGGAKSADAENAPPDSRQHFDIWAISGVRGYDPKDHKQLV